MSLVRVEIKIGHSVIINTELICTTFYLEFNYRALGSENQYTLIKFYIYINIFLRLYQYINMGIFYEKTTVKDFQTRLGMQPRHNIA